MSVVSRRASGIEQRSADGKRELGRAHFPMLVGEWRAVSQDGVTRGSLFTKASQEAFSHMQLGLLPAWHKHFFSQ